MNSSFKTRSITIAISLAFPATLLPNPANAGFYPPLPPSLSTSVTPNVLLHIDNSGSMRNKPSKTATRTKMESAIAAANALVDNASVRWGIFSFDPKNNTTAGILQAPIGSDNATLHAVINGLAPETNTPLGETLFEMTRYYSGSSSYYNKIKGNYESPIQYRCQKNFAIVITDGVSNGDNTFPGINGRPSLSYTSYDADGTALSRTFKVCQDTTTSSSISCPFRLEGSNTANGDAFVGTADSDTTLGRSIRDVAMYAYDADLRVGGTDLDRKSFDDPKFKKQNLITYTVGFAIDDPVLKATATVGGGTYQTAGNEAALNAALNSAINDIIAQTSNAGGISPRSDVKSTGNIVLQPVFNAKGWYGELRCKTLRADGTIGPDCANPKATIPAAGSRQIYTSKVSSAPTATSSGSTAFSFDTGSTGSMTSSQLTSLGTSSTDRNNVINWLRGGSISGLRIRSNGLLGDMLETQPIIISAPSGSTPDIDYADFKTSNSSRSLALIGANDGMMHAFSLGTMGELMGYVPAGVYGNLAQLAKTDYGSTTGGTAHAYYVSGGARAEDVKIGSSWKTLLVSGLGQGGQGYFALDATSESTLTAGAASAVKWDWTDVSDSRMGYTFGTPIIYNVRTSATEAIPAAIFTNGYENDYDDTTTGGVKGSNKTSVLYVVNVATGALIGSIEVPNSTGLSGVAGWDYDSDGVIDYVYAGDINGKVWRFDLTRAGGFKVSPNPIFDAGSTQPVVQRPAIYPTSDAGEAMVIFGTGKLLVDADRTSASVQAIYGVVDRFKASTSSSSAASASSSAASTITTAEARTATKANLVQQSILDTYAETGSTRRNGTYRKASSLAVDLSLKRGWYLELPGTGERLLTSPLVYQDKVLFGTGLVQSGEACLSGGKGWIMALNPLTGSVPVALTNGNKYSFVDLNGDKKSSIADQLAFASGAAYAVGYDLPAMPTEMSVISDTNAAAVLNTSGAYGSAGARVAMHEVNAMGVYRRTDTTSGSSSSGGNSSSGNTSSSGSSGSAASSSSSSSNSGCGSSGGGTGNPASAYNQGKGISIVGTVGNDAINTENLLGPSCGIRVETGPWRELK